MTPVTTLPLRRPLRRADLEQTPDDGHRYELVDGTLLVSPAPSLRHQRVVGALHLLLSAACPEPLLVVLAPFAVGLADDTEVQPDLLVAPRTQFTERDLPGAPLLAVEVLSPSTRRIDLLLKRDRLQAAGVPSYWLVDPDAPSLTVLELVEGTYREVAAVGAGQSWTASVPFAVSVTPDRLVR